MTSTICTSESILPLARPPVGGAMNSDTMYLVGDISDGWRLKKKVYWPAEHNDIVWRILKRAKRGTRIVSW